MVPGVSGENEDLLAFDDTTDTWSLYFDGSDVGLDTTSNEDVDGVWVADTNGDIYLTTLSSFAVSGLSGEREDVFICTPLSTGANTACDFGSFLYWRSATHELGNNNLDGLSLISGFTEPVPCTLPPNCSFENGFNQWTITADDPANTNWVLSSSAYNGQLSAHGTLFDTPDGSNAKLRSSVMAIESNTKYRFSFFGMLDNLATNNMSYANIQWISGGGTTSSTSIINFDNMNFSWQQYFTNSGEFMCPFPGTDSFRFEFGLIDEAGLEEANLLGNDLLLSVLVDDLLVETQPSTECPLSP